ncbi:hypothetical protein [Natronorubrum sp. DTA7]|uniref:hypothetical protein n=1 Tax=Natronorubrum sp. DTA7 TaxID=3447016 RepID=UPI003F86D4D7
MSSNDATGATAHVEQSMFPEWRAFSHAGHTLVAHDVPEGLARCYRVVGTTRNVRALTASSVDAVLHGGTLVEPFYDEATRRVLLQHDYAGTKARLDPEAWLEDPVVKLARCERVDLGQRLESVETVETASSGGRDV